MVASLEDRTLRNVVTRKKDEISVGWKQREQCCINNSFNYCLV